MKPHVDHVMQKQFVPYEINIQQTNTEYESKTRS